MCERTHERVCARATSERARVVVAMEEIGDNYLASVHPIGGEYFHRALDETFSELIHDHDDMYRRATNSTLRLFISGKVIANLMPVTLVCDENSAFTVGFPCGVMIRVDYPSVMVAPGSDCSDPCTEACKESHTALYDELIAYMGSSRKESHSALCDKLIDFYPDANTSS